MKKILSFILTAILMFGTLATYANAEILYEEQEVYDDYDEASDLDYYVEIYVNVNEQIVRSGGNDVQCAAPYLSEKGVTMLPVEVIANAFGCEIQIETPTVTVTYFDVPMIYTVGQATADING